MTQSKGVLILGAGSAGLLIAKHLAEELMALGASPRDICVMGKGGGGSSVLSSWYVAQYEPVAFEERLIAGLGDNPRPEQIELVKYIARNHVQATEDFARDVVQHSDTGGLKRFTDGFSQIKALTGYSAMRPLPGKRILEYLKRQIAGYGVRFTMATITDLEHDEEGFQVHGMVRGNERVLERCATLVIATGGMAHVYEFATSAHGDYPNVLELAGAHLGLEVEDLHRAVFFPFAVYHEGYRAGSLLPPSFMTKAEVLMQTPDGELHDFLSDHLKAAIKGGDYRPQFPELISLFNQIIADGNRVMVRTMMSPEEFEYYCDNDHYGHVFQGKNYEDVSLVGIAPAYHSALGGIVVDAECRTSNPGVFAVGESAMIFGRDRPIGGEHVSAITLAPLVARVLAREAVDAGRVEMVSRPAVQATDLVDLRGTIDELDWSIVELILNARNRGADERLRDLAGGDKFVDLLMRRLIAKVDRADIRAALSAADEGSFARICGTAFATALDEVLLDAEDIWNFLEAIPGPAYEQVVELVSDRLSVVCRVAPLKLAEGQTVRDSAREEEVIQRVANIPSKDSDRTLVASLFRHVVLPCSFEVQQLYRDYLAT